MNKQHCVMLWRSLYLEICFIRFELDILWLFGELNATFFQQFQKIKLALNELQEIRDDIGSSLRQSHNSRELTEISNNLERVLRHACEYRYDIWKNLLGFIDINQRTIPELSAVNQSFFNANHATHVIMLFNLKNPPSQELVEKLENVLSVTINQLKEIIEHIKSTKLWQDVQLTEFIKSFFGNLYQDAFTCQRRILLLRSWLQILTEKKNEITKRYSPRNISRVLKVKQVFDVKDQYYLEFYDEVRNKSYIIHESLIHTAKEIIAGKESVVTPETILKELYDEEQQFSQKISDIEAQLKNYSWPQALFSSSKRLYTESFCYKCSERYFIFVDELRTNDALCNYPILNNVRFQKEFLNILTILGSNILLSIYAYAMGWRGISYATFNTLCQLLLPESESIIKLGKRVYLDDAHVMRILPSVKRLLGLGLYIGINRAWSLLGFKTEPMSLLLVCYITASACESLSVRVLDKLKQRRSRNTDDHSSTTRSEYSVQNLILMRAVSLFGLNYLGPKIYGSVQTFFKPKPTIELLSDSSVLEYLDEYRGATFKNGL